MISDRILEDNRRRIRKQLADLRDERFLLQLDWKETSEHLLETVKSEYGQESEERLRKSANAIKKKYPVFFESDSESETENDGNPNPSSQYKERKQIKQIKEYIDSELNVNQAQLDEIERDNPDIFNEPSVSVILNRDSNRVRNRSTSVSSDTNPNVPDNTSSNINAELTPNTNPNTNPYINPVTNPFIGVNLGSSINTNPNTNINVNSVASSSVNEDEPSSKRRRIESESLTQTESSNLNQEDSSKKHVRFSDKNESRSVDDFLKDLPEDHNPFDDIGID